MKIKIPAGRDAGACCDKEYSRYAATGCAVIYQVPAPDGDGCRSFIVSCNGQVAAMVPVKCEGYVEPTLLPADAVKGNGQGRELVVEGKECRWAHRSKSTVLPMPDLEGRFPGVYGVMPKVESFTRTLTLNARTLERLASAISETGVVTLLLPEAWDDKTDHPGVVRDCIGVVGRDAAGDAAGTGVIMPLAGLGTPDEHRKQYETTRELLAGFRGFSFPLVKPAEEKK